jgi:endonuclease I
MLFITATNIFAQIPAGYYDAATGTGYTLKTQLYNIIKGHTTKSYDELYNGYKTTDTDNYFENDGTVLDIYTEKPTATDVYNYSHGALQCGNYSVEGDCYNREHLFPQGFFNEASPMKSDIHFVVPSDGKVNGMRSNYPFGEVGSATFTSTNGSKLGNCISPGYTGTVFEPIDEFKGDIARCLLYFVTRYENLISGFEVTSANNPLDGSTDQAYEDWFIELLLKWHNEDPVNQREIDRNNAAYDYQGNRNPYIDHPNWVECVWENQCSGIYFNSSPVSQITIDQPYSYTVTYTGANTTLTCETKPAWLNYSGTTLSGTPSEANIGNHSVSFKLTDGTNTVYQNFTITVNDVVVVQPSIINTDISTCSPIGFSTYSVTSNKNWDCASGFYMANGYGADVASNDWIIFPAINFDNYSNEVLTFDSWTQYTDISFPRLFLKYSTNYPGTGNPSSYTWSNLSYTPSPENSQTWTSSGNIDLSGISGTNVYLAFQYTSSGTGAASSSKWEVDNILLTGTTQSSSSVKEIISNRLILSPNPAKDYITIESDSRIANYTILNTIGQTVLEKNHIIDNKIEINISNLKSGIYFIRVFNTDAKINIERFIKE